MGRRRAVVGGFDADRVRATARRLRDEGVEVVLLGSDPDVDGLGHAVVAEDATEAFVGSKSAANRLHTWLNDHGVDHVTVRWPEE